ncbi:hypothetical protein AgCh_010485 [Apium graveolens]
MPVEVERQLEIKSGAVTGESGRLLVVIVDHLGYPASLPAAEPHRGNNSEQNDPHRELAQFPGGYRDSGLEPRGQYHGP